MFKSYVIVIDWTLLYWISFLFWKLFIKKFFIKN
jgi:hypothetical protein